MNKRVALVLRCAVSVGLLAWILSRQDLRRVVGFLSPDLLAGWLVAVAVAVSGFVVSSLKLTLLLRGFEVRAGWWRVFRAYCVGAFVGNVLPSTAGADLVKFTIMQRWGGRRTHILAALFAERCFGVFSVVLVAALGLPFSPARLPVWVYALVYGLLFLSLVGAGAAVLLCNRFETEAPEPALPQRWIERLLRLACRLVRRIVRDKSLAPNALALSLVFVAHNVANGVAILWALGHPLPVFQMVSIVCVVQVVTIVLPITINGLGVREWAYALLLGAHGLSSEVAVTMSLLIYLSAISASLLGGAFAISGDPSVASEASSR